jgi:hypothetical protein
MTRRKLTAREPTTDTGMVDRLSSGADELISAIAEFLVRSDLPRETVARALETVAIRVRSGEPVSVWQGGVADFTDRLGHAYQAWWNDPAYLDTRGNPVPLRVSGSRRSVGALLRARLEPDEIDYALQALRESPSITIDADGYWRPHEPTLVLRPDRELSFQRLVGLVRGLLNTFHSNNSKRRSGDGLMERTVVSGNLPANFVPVLSRAVHEHFGQALFAILQMIKNAEQRSGRRSGTEVGVEVFMYELPRAKESRGVPPRPRATGKKRKSRPR